MPSQMEPLFKNASSIEAAADRAVEVICYGREINNSDRVTIRSDVHGAIMLALENAILYDKSLTAAIVNGVTVVIEALPTTSHVNGRLLIRVGRTFPVGSVPTTEPKKKPKRRGKGRRGAKNHPAYGGEFLYCIVADSKGRAEVVGLTSGEEYAVLRAIEGCIVLQPLLES
jgi:hypothetical protein